MSARKKALLKKHRRNKRIILALLTLILAAFIDFGVYNIGPWWVSPILAMLFWLAHEAWFADHLFYSPRDSYRYSFPPDSVALPVALSEGQVLCCGQDVPVSADTLILEVDVRSTWAGFLLDPQVLISGMPEPDRQDFERRVSGKRYLNLSGAGESLRVGKLTLKGKHCRLGKSAILHAFSHPDFSKQKVMIIAPHADDAELAAFGLYSESREPVIVTLTQGEIEAGYYCRLGLDTAAAARLKGRLRTWNSYAVPLWGDVPIENCVQLGYYCLQLSDMHAHPGEVYGSRESEEADIRGARYLNKHSLPGDADGLPTWQNLIDDLVELLEQHQPEVVVMPHPELDPHDDHVHATLAVDQAIAQSSWKPGVHLLYANHLADNDRWPMGPANCGVALPPAIEPLPAYAPWSPLLSSATRIDKAMALSMQHDLQIPLPFKKRLRRVIQRFLAGRVWPAIGEDEFFRKAVRRHELFWVCRPTADGLQMPSLRVEV
ncbi:GlcNAc-PI de-N-acetylase [Pseudomonas sp. TTU2014-105ASC]|nr:GlcNAc-PI de-N-acetylase [Pseudomonas sp. TTU2014-105ASC]